MAATNKPDPIIHLWSFDKFALSLSQHGSSKEKKGELLTVVPPTQRWQRLTGDIKEPDLWAEMGNALGTNFKRKDEWETTSRLSHSRERVADYVAYATQRASVDEHNQAIRYGYALEASGLKIGDGDVIFALSDADLSSAYDGMLHLSSGTGDSYQKMMIKASIIHSPALIKALSSVTDAVRQITCENLSHQKVVVTILPTGMLYINNVPSVKTQYSALGIDSKSTRVPVYKLSGVDVSSLVFEGAIVRKFTGRSVAAQTVTK